MLSPEKIEWLENDVDGKVRLSKKEKIDLRAELIELKKWEKFNESVGFISDIADEVEDRICEIKEILEKDEEEYYSDFEHTPTTL